MKRGSSWMYGLDPANCTVVKYSHLFKGKSKSDTSGCVALMEHCGKFVKGKVRLEVKVDVWRVLFYLLPENPGWHWHWYVVVEEARQEPCLQGSAKHGEACGEVFVSMGMLV